MKHIPTNIHDLTPFTSALHLYPTVEPVVEHNVSKLKDSSQPIATIKAVHTGANAHLMMQVVWKVLYVSPSQLV